VLTRLDLAQGTIEPENLFVPLAMPPNRRRRALDIGANNGVTATLMAKTFQRVEAFEPHPVLSADLAVANIPNTRIHAVAVSATVGNAELLVPISKGVRLTGWSSLTGTLFESHDDLQRYVVSTVTIDDFAFTDVDYMKIDVEGHELDVLRGAAKTIRQCQPWIVVEALGQQQLAVENLLAPLGYTLTDLQLLTGRPGSPHNLLYIPSI